MSSALIGFAATAYAFREAERTAARPLLLAVVGAAMHGAHSEGVERALAALPPAATRLRASLIGRDDMCGPITAALINGIAAADGATVATPVVCAALVAGEAAGASGAAVIDAVIAGVEIALRVERALGGHAERGWDVRGTCGRLGAAIAAARTFGLQRGAVRNAFGLAATSAGGLRAAAGTMTEAYVVGSAAADGIEAALLARAEFTAAPAALEGRRGFAALMATSFDMETLLAALGERFALGEFAALPASAPPVSPAVRDVIAQLDRAPSVVALLAATRA